MHGRFAPVDKSACRNRAAGAGDDAGCRVMGSPMLFFWVIPEPLGLHKSANTEKLNSNMRLFTLVWDKLEQL